MKYRIIIEVEVEENDCHSDFVLRDLVWNCMDAHKDGSFNTDYYKITSFEAKAELLK